MSTQMVHVGVRGQVLALDRTTGSERWRTRLTRSDFVNLVAEGDRLYATSAGEVFCLDAATGAILWHNRLKGLGIGLVSILAPGAAGAQGGEPALAEAARRRTQSSGAG